MADGEDWKPDQDPKHIMEQKMALYRDIMKQLPSMLWDYHQDLTKQGFSPIEVIQLVGMMQAAVLNQGENK